MKCKAAVIDDFENRIRSVDSAFSRKVDLAALQANMGNMCNQECAHCHVNASPKGGKIMPGEIVDDIITFLSKTKGMILDITGGCPELNPNFKCLVKRAKPHVRNIISRSNLTIFFEKGMEDIPEFYAKNRIRLICSMPCYTAENVDGQRGGGVFEKSIKALKILNELGYGKKEDLQLDLVYNPGGPFLPPDQKMLENNYKKILYERDAIVFNRLLTITNAPINRFAQYLKARGEYDGYIKLLVDNFNEDIAGDIMCRNLLSVGYDGTLYDCDFNQALGLTIRDEGDNALKIGSIRPEDLKEKEITFKNHCYCCTAGAGSSCGGALKGVKDEM